MQALLLGRGSFRPTSLILVLVAAGSTRAQSCFERGDPLPRLADVVNSMAAADLDGDGAADLVVANDERDTVSVLLNQGAGAFSPAVDYAAGDEPSSVAIADLDGDGHPDVVTADFRSNTLSVLMNRGQGRLAPRVEYQIATGPCFVTTADLNGDGAPDLVAVDYSTNAVSVLLNLGDGTFGPEAICFVGPNPTSVACADVDGDGNIDLVVDNYGWHNGTGSITVLMNQGNGTFTARPEIVLNHPYSMLSIVSGDFDGDGHVDVAIPLLNESSVLFLFNRGDGRFERQITREVFDEPYSIWVADTDFDGRPDIVTLGDNYGVSVLRNLGNREFAPYVYSGSRGYMNGALADFDGDGRPDLAAQAAIQQGLPVLSVLSVMFNLGDGRFAERGQVPLGSHPSCVISADLDMDGAPDLISTVQYPDALYVLRNRGDGSFEPAITYAAGERPSAVASADFDGDGTPDLVVTNYASNTASIFLNRGDGTLRPLRPISVGDSPVSVACADLDGDGRPDLAVGSLGSSAVSILLNLGGGTFAPAVDYPLNGLSLRWTVSAADLNHDGHLDLAVSGVEGVAILRNLGNVTFGQPDFYGTFNEGPVAVGDLDGDGYPDIALTSFSADVVEVLLNRGDGTFGSSHAYVTEFRPTGVFLTDFDGDGSPDLVVMNSELDSISVFLNTGNGRFGPGTKYVTGRSPVFVASADIDADGDADLVVASSAEATLSILRNCRASGNVFCAGDGSGTPCPCGNSSAPGSGAGCLDSRGAAASLRASGSARLAHDELVLAAMSLPGGIALYLQGTARENGGAGTVYGDGLRCINGTLRQIAAVASASGSSSYPRSGDPSISLRGAVQSPGTRTYQIVYRDRASFCTQDTFNLSNGVEVVWGP